MKITPFPKFLQNCFWNGPGRHSTHFLNYPGVVTDVCRVPDTGDLPRLPRGTRKCPAGLTNALVNELVMIFARPRASARMKSPKTAGTKWNFDYYRPGLWVVTRIPVDPYYPVKIREGSWLVILAGLLNQ